MWPGFPSWELGLMWPGFPSWELGLMWPGFPSWGALGRLVFPVWKGAASRGFGDARDGRFSQVGNGADVAGFSQLGIGADGAGFPSWELGQVAGLSQMGKGVEGAGFSQSWEMGLARPGSRQGGADQVSQLGSAGTASFPNLERPASRGGQR